MARSARTTTRALTKARTVATTRTAVNYPKELVTTSYFGSANLKAYYQFKNGGELNDSTANANTLTAIGVPVQATPRWGTGCVGLGTSQAFSAVDGADFQPAGNFSVSAWIRTTKTATAQMIFQSYSAANVAGLQLCIDTSNRIILLSGKKTGTVYNTDYSAKTGAITTNCNGAWHHVVGTYDGAKLHVYIDGAEDGTGSNWTNAAAFNSTSYVRVGCQNNSGSNVSYFQGCLDEVSFFPSDALSLAQVQSLYAASITDGSNSAIKDLASAVYLFNGGAQLTDSSTGAENTLTAIGTPTTCTPKFGGSVFLGNSSAYSAVDADVLKPTGAFSVGGWIKTAKTATYQYIYNSWATAGSKYGGIVVLINDSNQFGIFSGKNSGTTLDVDWKRTYGATNVCDGNWHFCVVTFDGSYLRNYVDGKLDATATSWANAPVYQATNYVRAGCRSDDGTNSGHFQGQLDDIFLLNGTALSADEVHYLYTERKRVV